MDILNLVLILIVFGNLLDFVTSFELLARPKNMTVNIGDTITLQCIAKTETLYHTWELKSHKDSLNKDGTLLGFCYSGKQCVVKIWNDQMQITNSSQLIIRNITSEHSGQYFCETSPFNGYDIIKASAWIFVKTPPKSASIDFNSSLNMFNEMESIAIKCSVTGSNPPPRVSISIVVGNIITDLKTDLVNSPLLTTNEVYGHALWRPSYTHNQGFVMCTAINDAGVLTKNSSLLNIKFEPKIQPFKSSNISALVNQFIDLNCQVNANPPATVKWLISDGLRIIASSQLITKVQSEMRGNLTCVAENEVGSVSRSIKLVVLRDPVIQLQSVYKVKEKSDVSISCQVEATPEPDYIKWYKVSSDSDNRLTLLSNDAKLNFINIDRSSTGRYACVTKNTQRPSDGKIKEATVKKDFDLVVTYLPAEPWIRSDNEVKVQKGEQLRISCSANSKSPGEPIPNLSWVDVNTRNTVSQTYELTIENATSIHNGEYKCMASNELGSTVSSKTVVIYVHEPPMVIYHKESNFFLGYSSLPDSFSFPCTFQGQPLHSINWHYQGGVISTNKNYQITTTRNTTHERAVLLSSNLRITLSNQMQSTSKSPPSGTYSCETTNEYGTASFEYNLVIKYPPLIKINRRESKVVGSLGQDSVSLKCMIESIEEPKVAWFRTHDQMELTDKRYAVMTIDASRYNPGVDIFAPGVKITELRISDLLIGDFTGYSCIATNKQGSNKGMVEVVFKSKPDAPYDVKVTSVEWDSITISWKSGFNGGIEQNFEINVYSEEFGQQNVPFYTDKIDNRLTLKGLHPNTNYSVKLFAVNALGKSDSSLIITCVTKRITKFDNIQARILPDQPRVAIFVPDIDMCANLDYTRDNGRQWFNIQHCLRFNSSQINVTVLLDISQMTSIYDLQAGLVRLRLTFCLLSQPGICSNYMVLDNPKVSSFTTQTMILVIAVICVVLIMILAILFVICCIRFKYSCHHWYWYCCCCRSKADRPKSYKSRQLSNKRMPKQEVANDGRHFYEENLDDTVITMGSPNNYCSNMLGCSTPHIMNKSIHSHNPNDIYSSFTCQHQTQPPIYYEGSSFLQPAIFSWTHNLNTQSYEASSSNSHSSAGSSSRTMNQKNVLKHRTNQENFSNSVIINQKSLLELNEKMQLPDVTSEAIHFVKSLDTAHVLEAVV